MKFIPESNTRFRLILLSAAGGFIGGFFASGGGIIFVYIFKKYFGGVKEIFPTVITVTLFSSAVNSLFYSRANNISGISPIIILSGMAGAIFGCSLFDKLKLNFLKNSFAVLSIISGVITILQVFCEHS